jgi:hypothetical protein
MVVFLAMHRLATHGAVEGPWPRARTAIPVTLAVLTCLRFSAGQWRDVYRDDRIRHLTAVVQDGPYRWLRTTPEKRAYIERAQAALREHAGNAQRLAVFNRFPGAHLMVPVRPAAPTVWISPKGTNREAISRAIADAPRPTLVMQVFRLPMTVATADEWTYAEGDTLVRTLKRLNARTVFAGADFALYEIPAPGRSP